MKIRIPSNRLGAILAVLCVVMTSSMTSSAAAAGWSAPATLGAPKASWVATAATDNTGNAVAAWLQTDTVPYKVHASLRKAGRLDFGPVSDLSGSLAFNPYPLVARVDRLGNVFVVWEDQGSVYGAVRAAGSNRWSPAKLVASGVSLAGFELDSFGNATLLVGTFLSVQVIDRPAGGSWGSPQTIASHTYSAAVGLAMADDGGAVAIWETYDKTAEYFTNFVLHASRRVAWAESWGPVSDLSVPLTTRQITPSGHAAVVGIDPRGNALVVGRQLDNDTYLTLGALTSPADDDTWSDLQIVSAAGTQAGYPSVAVDGSGLATLVWADLSPSSVFVSTAELPANTWTTPVMISQPGTTTGYPLIGTNRAGMAVVTWPAINGNGSMSLQVTVRPTRPAAWGTPVTLSTSSAGLSNARPWVDKAGRALLVWNETPPNYVGQTTKTSTYRP
jgi:hypothetical protein